MWRDAWLFYLLDSLSFFSQHSLGDILSSDFYNDNDVVPALFTMLHATDVHIASGLCTEREGPYIALLEVIYQPFNLNACIIKLLFQK